MGWGTKRPAVAIQLSSTIDCPTLTFTFFLVKCWAVLNIEEGRFDLYDLPPSPHFLLPPRFKIKLQICNLRPSEIFNCDGVHSFLCDPLPFPLFFSHTTSTPHIDPSLPLPNIGNTFPSSHIQLLFFKIYRYTSIF